jgi:hypothetical protein
MAEPLADDRAMPAKNIKKNQCQMSNEKGQMVVYGLFLIEATLLNCLSDFVLIQQKRTAWLER